MRKKNINLKDEEANTQMFLEKLNKFKQGAKNLKEKTKFTAHKVEWIREYQTLEKIEAQISSDLNESIRNIDLDCAGALSELKLFSDSKQGAKNFGEYMEELEKKNHLNDVNFWFQVRNLRSLVEELQTKDSEVDVNAMKELFSDVKKFFIQMQEILISEYKNILKERETHSDLIAQVLNKQDQVSGFDKELDANLEIILNDKKLISQDILDSIAPMKENYLRSLHIIDETYTLELQRISMDFNPSIPDFWTEQMKDMFYHIYKTYIKRGKDREAYIERLMIQFPGIPRKQIEVFDQYIMDNEYCKKKMKALYRDWQKEKNQMKSFAEEQILNQIEYLIQETENVLAKIKTNKELARIQQIIESQREEFEKRRKENEEKIALEKAKEDWLRQIKAEKFKAHAQEVKDQTIKYVEDRKKRSEESKINNLRELNLKQTEIKKKIEQNKPVVAARQDNEIVKIKTKIEVKERKQKEKVQNEERIEKAIESYSIRPVIERDFNRVVKETESLVSKKNTEFDKSDQVKLFKVHGFSANELMKDMRYKISAALFDAGLHNTEYAKNLIVQMSRPPKN